MNTRLLITLLCTGAIAFACGPRSHTEASTTTNVKSRSRHDGELMPTLLVSRQGDRVAFALRVVNRGTKQVELSFASGQTHDIVVLDSVGREVWRAGEGRMYTQALQNRVIDGGDSLVLQEQWTASAKPGTYTAVALLKSTDHPIEQRTTFALR